MLLESWMNKYLSTIKIIFENCKNNLIVMSFRYTIIIVYVNLILFVDVKQLQ